MIKTRNMEIDMALKFIIINIIRKKMILDFI